MAFLNNNIASGVSAEDNFQVGVSNTDFDRPGTIEQGFLLPWPADPSASWVYYDCTISVMMDSGIVVHNRLPQIDNVPDTLASCILDDTNLAKLSGGGINLKSYDSYEDIVQRMAHSRYWFRIQGQALRVGLQVPIPTIKTIGGVPAIPYDNTPQWAFNRIAPGGNYGGIILWHAAWSLWYTTAKPPTNNKIPVADPAAHIDGNIKNPEGIQVPHSRPDSNAVASGPAAIRKPQQGFFVRPQ